jgi:hypothetical protein
VGACGTKIADDNLNWRNRRWNFEKYALGLSACVNLFQVLSTKAAGLRLCPNAEQIQPKKGRGGGSGGTGGCSKNLDDVEPNMSVEEWYYKSAEYGTFSAAKRKGLIAKRKNCGGDGLRKWTKTNNKSILNQRHGR